MQQLKGIFPNSPLPKHQPLHVLITRPGPFSDPSSRVLIFPELGRVNDGRIAKEFFLAYFDGHGISPAVRRPFLIDTTLTDIGHASSSSDEEGCGGDGQQASRTY
jgi:hypothetical protein